jgi:hypothetical protein
MPFRDVRHILEYWMERPPEHEMLITLAIQHFGWRPPTKPLTEAEVIAAHRKSLEQRWAAGAMNPKQLYEAMGGRPMTTDGTVAEGAAFDFNNPPGIGPFPGAH